MAVWKAVLLQLDPKPIANGLEHSLSPLFLSGYKDNFSLVSQLVAHEPVCVESALV